VVVHSSSHDQRRQNQIERDLAREKTSLDKSMGVELDGSFMR
jgi:hypothetical protein